MLATMSEAHAEWHRNADVPMGTAGCPQDACDGDDPRPQIKCGHCKRYHRGIWQVKDCSGVFVDARECEHGLALWLCAGPGHYPADERN